MSVQDDIAVAEELRRNPEAGSVRLESQFKAELLALAKKLVEDKFSAEALVYQTFATAVAEIGEYDTGKGEFKGWMYGIMKRCHARGVRRKSEEKVSYTGTLPEVTDEDAEQEVYRSVDHAILRDTIASMPKEMKDVLILHYFMDASLSQMAKTLSIPVGTVKSRLHYARVALAKRFGTAVRKHLMAFVVAGIALFASAAAMVASKIVSPPGGPTSPSAAEGPMSPAAAEESRLSRPPYVSSAEVATSATLPAPISTNETSTTQKGARAMNIANLTKATAPVVAAAAMAAAMAANAAADDPYIESEGALGFNTGYYVGPNTRIEMDYQMTEEEPTPQVRLLGFQGPTDNSASDTENPRFEVYLGQNNGTKLTLNASKADGSRQAANLYLVDSERHTLVVDLPASSGHFKVLTGGEEVYTSGSTFQQFLQTTSKIPLGLFGCTWCGSSFPDQPSNGYSFVNKAKMKVFGLKIFESGGLVRNFVPCVKGGVPGFKDECTGYFFTGENTDTVKYGGAIACLRDDPYVSTEINNVYENPVAGKRIYLNTSYLPPKTARIELDFAPLTPRWSSDNPYVVYPEFMFTRSNNPRYDLDLVALGNSARGWLGCKAGNGEYEYCLPLADAYNIRRTISVNSNTIVMVTSGYTNFVKKVADGTGIAADLSYTPLWLGTAYSDRGFAPMKIYGLKVYEADELVKDFRPFVTNGVPGMVDVLNPETLKFAATYGGGTRTNLVFGAGGDFTRETDGFTGCTDGSDEAYLEFDGESTRIDTGVVVNKDSVIEADFSLWNTRTAPQQVFLVQDGGNGILAWLYMNSQNNLSYQFKDFDAVSAVNTGVAADNTRKQFKFDGPNQHMTIKRGDAVLYDADMTDGERTRTGGTTTLKIGSSAACMRLYGFKVTTAGEVVRDFIPYVANGVAGLYDLCGKTFYPLSGGKVSGMKRRNAEGVAETFQELPLPAKVTKNENDTPTLFVKAAGAHSYEWYADGELVKNQTNDTLIVNWKKLKKPFTVEYSVVPVYSVFNETVKGEPAFTTVTMPPKGTALIFK